MLGGVRKQDTAGIELIPVSLSRCESLPLRIALIELEFLDPLLSEQRVLYIHDASY